MTPSCSSRAGSEHVLFYLERSISNLTTDQVRSGQGQVYLPKRLDEQVVRHHLSVYIAILSRVIDEKQIVTSLDLR